MTNKIDIRAALVKHHSRYRQPNESIISLRKSEGKRLSPTPKRLNYIWLRIRRENLRQPTRARTKSKTNWTMNCWGVCKLSQHLTSLHLQAMNLPWPVWQKWNRIHNCLLINCSQGHGFFTCGLTFKVKSFSIGDSCNKLTIKTALL